MAENSIINSQLFKKIESAEDYFTIEDLLQEIHNNIASDRVKINELLSKALNDSDELKDAIKEYNEIDKLPDIMIFGDIPNQYLNNLNNNVNSEIQFLNSVQKLQSNYINRASKNRSPEKSSFNLNDLLKQKRDDDE